MKTITADQANTLIRKANNKGVEIQIHIDEEERNYPAGCARLFPKQPEPGNYLLKIFEPGKKEDDDPIVSEYLIEVPAPPEKEPSAPVVKPSMSHLSGDLSVDMLLRLREQDAAAWEREREFHRRELEAVRDRYDAELRRAQESFEFRLSLLQGNQSKLDSERDAMADRQFKLAQAELRLKRRDAGNGDELSIKDLISLATTFFGGRSADESEVKNKFYED